MGMTKKNQVMPDKVLSKEFEEDRIGIFYKRPRGRKINCVMRRFFQAHRSGIGQRQGGAPALPTSVKLQQFKPISKLYR